MPTIGKIEDAGGNDLKFDSAKLTRTKAGRIDNYDLWVEAYQPNWIEKADQENNGAIGELVVETDTGARYRLQNVKIFRAFGSNPTTYKLGVDGEPELIS